MDNTMKGNIMVVASSHQKDKDNIFDDEVSMSMDTT